MSFRLLFLASLAYTYVQSMPLRPQEGQPVVHNHYNRIPNLPGIKGLKEQIMVSAHQESTRAEQEQQVSSDFAKIAEPTREVAVSTPSSCVNGFQTYADTTWNLMGLPYTVAYTLQACINACNAAGSTTCVAAEWYNGNACVFFNQAQTVGQVMSSSPDPTLPRTLITRCSSTTTSSPVGATPSPVTQAPATQAPTQGATSSPSSCANGFNTYSGTYDLMGLPYTVTYTASGCMNLCSAVDANTCAAAVWYNGNACVKYTAAQAAGKVLMASPDPKLPRTTFVRCSSTSTQAPATQAPTQPATHAPTQAATQPPATPAPATKPPATPAPATQAPTQSSTLPPDTSAPGSNGLAYQGGTVMTNPVQVYIVFYGSWSATDAKQQEMNIINTFVTNLGTSSWWNIQTSYYYPDPSTGSRTYVKNGVTLGGHVVVPIDNNNGGTSLTDTNVANIISNQINSGALPFNNDGVYFMVSSNEVYETGFCSSDCGWHSAAYVSGSTRIMKYGWIGDASTQCPGACTAYGSSPTPNGHLGADGIISVLAHEIAESVSDPLLSAWVGADYQENADKCAWQFISTYYTPTGAPANMNIGGQNYLIQGNWKNRDGGGCVLHL